jgi:hypothetical protein
LDLSTSSTKFVSYSLLVLRWTLHNPTKFWCPKMRIQKRQKSGYSLNKHCPENLKLQSNACRNSANGNGLLLDGLNDSMLQYKVLTMNLLQHNKKQMKINVLEKKGGLLKKIITLHSYKLSGCDNVYSSRNFPALLMIIFTRYSWNIHPPR